MSGAAPFSIEKYKMLKPREISNSYAREQALEDKITQNPDFHRKIVGGMWDEIGTLQTEYLKQNGLTPDMALIDVGCGSLRGGVRLIDYLDRAKYYGLDLSPALLRQGYEVELAQLGLQHKLPRDHLQASDYFDFGLFDGDFDMALAVSVFTHLPLEYLTVCLERLAGKMRLGSSFFATFFVCPDDHDPATPLPHEPGGITTHGARDPFHFRASDISVACASTGWTLQSISDWDHPRDQRMALFCRT